MLPSIAVEGFIAVVVLINTAHFGSKHILGTIVQLLLVSLVLINPFLLKSVALLLILRSWIHYLTVVWGGLVSWSLVVRNDRRVDENLLVLRTKSDDAMLRHLCVHILLHL